MSAWGWVIKLPPIGGSVSSSHRRDFRPAFFGRTFLRRILASEGLSLAVSEGLSLVSSEGLSLVASEELSLVASEGLSLVAPEGLSTHVYSRGKVFPFRGETSFCLFLFTRMPVLRFGRDANWW